MTADQNHHHAPDDQDPTPELLLARKEFRDAYASLHRIEPDSSLLKHHGFEYNAVHDVRGYDERALIMRERTRVLARRKVLDLHSANGS
ncbi:MAG: hypothetical protein ACYC5G_01510 [Candidatus Doudnabacteria bacterium]